MRWMLISTVIFGVSGVFMGILNARQHFLLPALAPVVYNLSIIAGAWFLGPAWGVRGLTAGVVIGAAGHLLTQIPGLLRDPNRMSYRPILAARDPSLHEVGRLMAPRVLGLAAVQINFMVTAVLAASLSEGSLTALNYGWIIMLLPQGIIALSVATALFPTLASLEAEGNRSEMRQIFTTTVRNLLFLTLPAAVGLLVLSEPIVRLLLERGAFDVQSTEATAVALRFFAIGLVGHALVEITTRAFYALKNTKTPVVIGIFAMVLNIVLSVALIRLFDAWGWQPQGGLALANSIAVTLEMIVLLLLLRGPLGSFHTPELRASILKISIAGAGMAASLLVVMPLLPLANRWSGGFIGILLGSAIYLGLAHLLGAPELAAIRRQLLRRSFRRL